MAKSKTRPITFPVANGTELVMDEPIPFSYRARPGSRLTDREAAVVGPELAELARERGGGFTPAEVVDRARPEGSPLHPHFTWDDAEAARLHREDEARQLARSVEVVIHTRETGGERLVPIRGFHSVVLSDDPGADGAQRRQVYVPLQTVAQQDPLIAQVIANAGRELRGWRERYNAYKGIPAFADRFGAALAVALAVEEAAD